MAIVFNYIHPDKIGYQLYTMALCIWLDGYSYIQWLYVFGWMDIVIYNGIVYNYMAWMDIVIYNGFMYT